MDQGRDSRVYGKRGRAVTEAGEDGYSVLASMIDARKKGEIVLRPILRSDPWPVSSVDVHEHDIDL